MGDVLPGAFELSASARRWRLLYLVMPGGFFDDGAAVPAVWRTGFGLMRPCSMMA